MGTRIYGIGAAQNKDHVGETVDIAGHNNQLLTLIKDEHAENNFFHKVGSITYSKKIFSAQDCENEKQLRCWNHAQVPLLYAEGELADDTDHPNAKASAAMVQFGSRSDIPLNIGFSVDGGIFERKNEAGQPDENGKIISSSASTALSLTSSPCNPKCKVWLENDLAKSFLSVAPPKRILDLIHAKRSKASIIDRQSKLLKSYMVLQNLSKSLDDIHSAFVDIQCYGCGEPTRFFKSSPPNVCTNCGTPFSMNAVWAALNK